MMDLHWVFTSFCINFKFIVQIFTFDITLFIFYYIVTMDRIILQAWREHGPHLEQLKLVAFNKYTQYEWDIKTTTAIITLN